MREGDGQQSGDFRGVNEAQRRSNLKYCESEYNHYKLDTGEETSRLRSAETIMIKVTVEVFPWLTRAFGTDALGHVSWQEELADEATVDDLLVNLARRHPQFGEMAFIPGTQELQNSISVVVNGRLAELLQGPRTVLSDGDIVVMLPAFSGG